jgi:hypothetical protein
MSFRASRVRSNSISSLHDGWVGFAHNTTMESSATHGVGRLRLAQSWLQPDPSSRRKRCQPFLYDSPGTLERGTQRYFPAVRDKEG